MSKQRSAWAFPCRKSGQIMPAARREMVSAVATKTCGICGAPRMEMGVPWYVKDVKIINKKSQNCVKQCGGHGIHHPKMLKFHFGTPQRKLFFCFALATAHVESLARRTCSWLKLLPWSCPEPQGLVGRRPISRRRMTKTSGTCWRTPWTTWKSQAGRTNLRAV